MSFLEGLLTGLAMIIFIGPVLFTLLQASLSYGYRGGLAVAVGIIVSDILAIMICLMGASAFLLDPAHEKWLAILGALILVGLAFRYLFRPLYFDDGQVKLGALDLSGLFVKGFLVNFINPFVFVIWIGIIGIGETKFKGELWIYLLGILIGIFLTDNLKSYFAAKLKRFLTHDRLKLIYQVIAVLLLLFAIRLIYFAIEGVEG